MQSKSLRSYAAWFSKWSETNYAIGEKPVKIENNMFRVTY